MYVRRMIYAGCTSRRRMRVCNSLSGRLAGARRVLYPPLFFFPPPPPPPFHPAALSIHLSRSAAALLFSRLFSRNYRAPRVRVSRKNFTPPVGLSAVNRPAEAGGEREITAFRGRYLRLHNARRSLLRSFGRRLRSRKAEAALHC